MNVRLFAIGAVCVLCVALHLRMNSLSFHIATLRDEFALFKSATSDALGAKVL
jgi:hypothetical protein